MIFDRQTKKEVTKEIDAIQESNVGYTPDELGIVNMTTDNLTGTQEITEAAYMINILHESFESEENVEGITHLCEASMPNFVKSFIAAVEKAIAGVKEYFNKLVVYIDGKVKDDKKFMDKYKGKFKAKAGASVNGFEYSMDEIKKLVDRIAGISPTGEVKALIDLAESSPTAEKAKEVVTAFTSKGKNAIADEIAKEVSGGKVSRYDELSQALIDTIRGGKKMDLPLNDVVIKKAEAFMNGTAGFIDSTKKLQVNLNKEKVRLIKGAQKVKGEIAKLDNSKEIIKPSDVLSAAKEAITTLHKVLQGGYGVALSQFKAGRVFWKGFLAKTVGQAVSESATVIGLAESIDNMIEMKL